MTCLFIFVYRGEGQAENRQVLCLTSRLCRSRGAIGQEVFLWQIKRRMGMLGMLQYRQVQWKLWGSNHCVCSTDATCIGNGHGSNPCFFEVMLCVEVWDPTTNENSGVQIIASTRLMVLALGMVMVLIHVSSRWCCVLRRGIQQRMKALGFKSHLILLALGMVMVIIQVSSRWCCALRHGTQQQRVIISWLLPILQPVLRNKYQLLQFM